MGGSDENGPGDGPAVELQRPGLVLGGVLREQGGQVVETLQVDLADESAESVPPDCNAQVTSLEHGHVLVAGADGHDALRCEHLEFPD